MSPRQWKRFGNSSLISDSAVYLASNLLNAAIPFLLLPVLTRYLNLAEYGQVAMFMTLIAALGAITGLNTNGSAGRKYYDHGLSGNEFALFIGSCLWILVVSSLLVFLVLWAFQGRFAHWLALPPHWVLWAVAASTAGFIIQLRLGQWQVRKQARSYGILQVGQSLMNMLLSLLLVVGLSLGGEGRMMGLLATSLAFAALGLYLLARDGLSAIAWRSAYVKEALAFGVPLVLHVAGLFLLSVTDRIVVTTELGVAQTGLYHVAAQLAGALGILSECRRARDAKRDIPVPLSPCARATTCTCRGRPAPGPRLRHFAPPPDPYDEWLDGVSDALASGLRQLRDLRPLRHFGQPLAPTPTADYPPRASRFPGGQRSMPSIRPMCPGSMNGCSEIEPMIRSGSCA